MKIKSSLKKLISFALVTAMLVCSVFTMSVNAVDNESNTVVDIDFEQLAEALANIDEDNYTIIQGDGYEIRRIELMYGYAFETKIGYEENENDISLFGFTPTTKNEYIRQSMYSGNVEVAYAQMNATFTYSIYSNSISGSAYMSAYSSMAGVSFSTPTPTKVQDNPFFILFYATSVFKSTSTGQTINFLFNISCDIDGKVGKGITSDY